MSGKSWYETGFEGAQKEQERRDLGYPPDRWWLKAGNSKEIVFIDDDPFCLQEHTWRDSNDRWHHATCIAKLNDGNCPACSAKGVGRPDYVGHMTVVDVTGYVDRDGNEHKYRLMLMPAKTKFLNRLRKKKENLGSLLGQLWTLTRADSNAPNTGDELDKVRDIENMDGLLSVVTYKGKSLLKMLEEANAGDATVRRYLSHHFRIPEEGEIPMEIPVLNYPVLMEPKSPAELRSAVADAKPFGGRGGSSAGSSSSTSDDIPF